jgi:hypothetical protein
MSSTLAESKLGRLRVHLDPPIARIVLNHPPLNVIDIP